MLINHSSFSVYKNRTSDLKGKLIINYKQATYKIAENIII